MTILIVYTSIYYGNTEKIARVIAQNLGATLTKPQQLEISQILNCDLVGFGSGIYYNQHHQSLFECIQKCSQMRTKKAFIFSTSRNGDIESHLTLHKKLEENGFEVLGNFTCKGYHGFQDWQIMKVVGEKGINQGKPDEEDMEKAKKFAVDIKNNNSIR